MNTRKINVLVASRVIASGLFSRAETPPAVFKAGAGTLDPLYASAVVIQAGDKKLAIVGLDLGRSPAEKSIQNIRTRIKKKAGIEYSFIAGSHTHHGPVLELTDEEGSFRQRSPRLPRRSPAHRGRQITAVDCRASHLPPLN